MNKIPIKNSSLLILMISIFTLNSCNDTTTNPASNTRDKFLGTWTVDESCVRLNYEVDILQDENDDNKVLLDNFADPGPGYDPAYGIVDGDVINLPKQKIGDNWYVNGTGTYQSDGTIFWSYHIEIGANASNCEADYK